MSEIRVNKEEMISVISELLEEHDRTSAHEKREGRPDCPFCCIAWDLSKMGDEKDPMNDPLGHLSAIFVSGFGKELATIIMGLGGPGPMIDISCKLLAIGIRIGRNQVTREMMEGSFK